MINGIKAIFIMFGAYTKSKFNLPKLVVQYKMFNEELLLFLKKLNVTLPAQRQCSMFSLLLQKKTLSLTQKRYSK